MFQLFHRDGVISPIVVPTEHGYKAMALIEREGGPPRSSGSLGYFASSNAAHNFAIDWAIANIEGRPAPRPRGVLLSLVSGVDVI
jgi:hypothetical protein